MSSHLIPGNQGILPRFCSDFRIHRRARNHIVDGGLSYAAHFCKFIDRNAPFLAQKEYPIQNDLGIICQVHDILPLL